MDEVLPGTTVTVEASVIASPEFKDQIKPGVKFQLREGHQVVATGTVERII